MARLQKKCFVFSVGVHVLLLLVLVLGPAFRTPPERLERLSQISLVSASAMEAALVQAQEEVLLEREVVAKEEMAAADMVVVLVSITFAASYAIGSGGLLLWRREAMAALSSESDTKK